ncbi:MAG: dTDP-4-dehydrorhamnose 3,5-epimerase family protein [bacterium]
MIEGVIIKELKTHPDERGRLTEILRSDDDIFNTFGQVYLTTNYPGVVKAWHLHHLQTDNVCCIQGMIKLVLFDQREHSSTYQQIQEFFIGDHQMKLISIPPQIFHGWKCISSTESIVINIPDKLYNYQKPDEYRLPFNTDQIPYNWDIMMK